MIKVLKHGEYDGFLELEKHDCFFSKKKGATPVPWLCLVVQLNRAKLQDQAQPLDAITLYLEESSDVFNVCK